MSVQDSKFEVYIVGYQDMGYVEKRYAEISLTREGFNLCQNIEKADFILAEEPYKVCDDYFRSKDYADVNCIEIVDNIYDLLKLREHYEFRGVI